MTSARPMGVGVFFQIILETNVRFNFYVAVQVPHYRHGEIVFDVHPPRASLTVTNDSVRITVPNINLYMG